MNSRVDPLEQHEGLRGPLALSVSFHAALLASTMIWSMLYAPVSLGDPTGNPGGAVSINVVQGIPLPRSRSTETNPVANPVKHDVPAVPEPPAPAQRVEEDDSEAVPLETSKKQAAKPKAARKVRKNPPPTPPNQVPSSTGARLNSPILSGQQQQSGSGGVGFGSGSPFGSRFGWYAEALQRRLAMEWSKTLGQVGGSSSKPVVVSFRILRNGAIESPRIVASSGNRTLDFSALRAVANSNPFRALPPQLGKSSIQVEMTFQLE